MIATKTFFYSLYEKTEKYRELIRYAVFGVLTTVVDYGVYLLLSRLFHVWETAANAAGWLAAVLFAFVTNKLFVFESKTWKPSKVLYEFVTFFASRAVTGIIVIAGFDVLHGRLGFNDILTKLGLSVLNVVVNYILSKLVTFRKKKDSPAPDASRQVKAGVRNGALIIGEESGPDEGAKGDGKTGGA